MNELYNYVGAALIVDDAENAKAIIDGKFLDLLLEVRDGHWIPNSASEAEWEGVTIDVNVTPYCVEQFELQYSDIIDSLSGAGINNQIMFVNLEFGS